MSLSLEDVFEAVSKEMYQLTHRWNVNLQLFDSGDDNLKLLNNSGSAVFNLLQKLLIQDAILTISRLTDPSGAGDRENASIENLLVRAKGTLTSIEYEKYEERREHIYTRVQDLVRHRNKAIAHSDLQHALNKKELPPLFYDDIESAMKELCTFMSDIARALFARSIKYNVTIPFGHGGDALLRILAVAHKNSSDNG